MTVDSILVVVYWEIIPIPHMHGHPPGFERLSIGIRTVCAVHKVASNVGRFYKSYMMGKYVQTKDKGDIFTT